MNLTRWISLLLLLELVRAGGQPGRTAAAPASPSVAYARCSNGSWQIWTSNLEGQDHRPAPLSVDDPRTLRAVPGASRLLFRDNQGRLFQWDPPQTQTVPVRLPDVEVIKDFDLDPARGCLVATYAPNALDNIRIWWFSPDHQEKRLLIADPHLNEMPRWIPGQSAFLFVKAHQGRSQICRASFERPRPRILFGDAFATATDPAPDPAGRRIAFCRETPNGIDLWIAPIEGGSPSALYAGPGLEAEPCWSLDGQFIVFASWDGLHFRIARIRPDGADFRWISPPGADCRYPAVFPSPNP